MRRVLLLLLLLTGMALAQTPTTADIAYASPSTDDHQKLDLYIPTGCGAGPFPVVIMMTGGGASGGGRDTFNGSPWTMAILTRCWAAAPISYRRVSPATWPTDLNDAKAAVRFLRANAATYNLDPDAIVGWGTSGGGRLASLLATTAGISLYDGTVGPHTAVSSAVAGGIAEYAPLDFTTIAADAAVGGCSSSFWASSNSILGCVPDGATYDACLPTATEASPALQVNVGSAPVLSLSGTSYCHLEYEHYRLGANLAAVGAPYGLLTMTGAGHGAVGAAGYPYYTVYNWNLIFRFLCGNGIPSGCTRTFR